MNEIKKIHIARQSYTIAVDAHSELKKYLDALALQLHDSEVFEEVELRIVELLTERKITSETVVLKKDVAYIRENLGEPSDFSSEDEAVKPSDLGETTQPRIFMRDPRGEILGGVSSGIAAYFGIDPLWIRLGFVLLTLASGFGVLLYLVLWVIMPAARTSSDYLQMQGKPVTVDSLTKLAEGVEVSTSMKRIGTAAVEFTKAVLRITLLAIGAGLTTLGMIGILSSIALSVYIVAASDSFFSGVEVFPVGALETSAVIIMGVVGVCASLLLLFSGMALFAKRWQLPNWATAALISTFFVGLFTGLPLGLSAFPKVESRVESARYTQTRVMPAFQQLEASGRNLDITYIPSDTYYIEVKTFGNKDITEMKTTVSDATLTVDTSGYLQNNGCRSLCLYTEDVQIIVHAPMLEVVRLNDSINFVSNEQLNQPAIVIEQDFSSTLSLNNVHANKITHSQDSTQKVTTTIEGIKQGQLGEGYVRRPQYGIASFVSGMDEVIIADAKKVCGYYDPVFELSDFPVTVSVGGQSLQTREQLEGLRVENELSSAANCVRIQ